MKHFLKHQVQKRLASRGYRIEKTRNVVSPLDAFDLLFSGLDPSDPNFFFIQVGANDGVQDDPLRESILRFHWKGILLEPQPEAFAALKRNYASETQLIFENCALAPQDGEAEFFRGSSSLLGSLRKQVVANNSSVKVTSTTVQTISPATLLKKHDVPRLDLLLIDAEGYDLILLEIFAPLLSRYPAKVIRFEVHNLSAADFARAQTLLHTHGYRLFLTGLDAVALRKAEEPDAFQIHLSLRTRFPAQFLSD